MSGKKISHDFTEYGLCKNCFTLEAFVNAGLSSECIKFVPNKPKRKDKRNGDLHRKRV